ncbi:sugar ABC transporter permease, partial [Streptomyces sp. SID7760]|nr:sugar ABC transporter permease [Streptomyces sp. SID7760]
ASAIAWVMLLLLLFIGGFQALASRSNHRRGSGRVRAGRMRTKAGS